MADRSKLSVIANNPPAPSQRELRRTVGEQAAFQRALEEHHNLLVGDVQTLNREILITRLGIQAALLVMQEDAQRRWWQRRPKLDYVTRWSNHHLALIEKHKQETAAIRAREEEKKREAAEREAALQAAAEPPATSGLAAEAPGEAADAI